MRALVEEHRERTGSPVAERVLDEWDELLPRFVKVMPRDYRARSRRSPPDNGELRYPDDRPISSGGEGFVTAEVESGSGRADGRARAPSSSSTGSRHPERDPTERVARLPRVRRRRSRATSSREQGARCMECGVPFCHNGCPLNNLIPDWNDLVYRDRWQEAIEQLHRTNNFPDFTGPALPRAVRGGVRARDPRGRGGHDQADRARDRQPRLGRGLDRAAAARRARPGGRSR